MRPGKGVLAAQQPMAGSGSLVGLQADNERWNTVLLMFLKFLNQIGTTKKRCLSDGQWSVCRFPEF